MTSTPCPTRSVPSSATLWRAAAADVATVASGVVSFGLVLGITIQALGRDPWAGFLGAALVYGGSAQLASVTVLAQGSGLVVAVLSGVVVNLRLLLYGAAMGERFADQPRWFRWTAPHTIIDQTFLVAQERPELSGADFRRYWGRLSAVLLAVWTCAVGAGLLLAPVLPPLPHLTLVCTCMFVSLLVPRLVARPAVVAATAGAASTALVGLVAPDLGILAGALCGIAAGSAASARPRA